MKKAIPYHRIFYLACLIYLVLGIINVNHSPPPSLDEIMGVDPAYHLVTQNKFYSSIWPGDFNAQHFSQYPPLTHYFIALNLKLFGTSIAAVRIPFLVLHILSFLILFLTFCKKFPQSIGIVFWVLIFFIFDKSHFVIARAIRAETVEIFLISLLFLLLFHYPKYTYLLGATLGLLMVCHLKLWPAVALLGMHLLFTNRTEIKKLIFLSLGFLSIWIAFGFTIQFNYPIVFERWFLQSKDHTAEGGFFERIQLFFVNRFFPVKEHFWTYILQLFILIYPILIFLKQKKLHILFVTVFVVQCSWLLILTPHFRYWPSLYCLSLPMIIIFFSDWNTKIGEYIPKSLQKLTAIVFVLILLIPFVGRHFIAIAQRQERNPDLAIEFLQNHIPQDKKVLLTGAGIGYYFSWKRKNVHFFETQYADNFRYNDYDKIYITSSQSLNYKKIATYCCPKQNTKFHQLLPKESTYNGLTLYEIQNAQEWDKLISD